VLKNGESQLQGLKLFSDEGAYGGVETPPSTETGFFSSLLSPLRPFGGYSAL
jgi:hypothetical protein